MNTASAKVTAHKAAPRNVDKLLSKGFRMLRSQVGHPNIFLVPLKEESVSKTNKFRSYSYGVRSEKSAHKVIMVVGATGAGKSTLINLMINYIFNVDWKDSYRLKLVNEEGKGHRSQAYTQTQNINSYTIHSNDHFKVSYTLTIIDTPGFGDTRGIEHDKAIVEQIKEFFNNPKAHGVDHIDAVGFVTQSSQARLTPTQRYIFESILAVFGKDIKPNILLMITFCDGQSPPVLEAANEAKVPFGEAFKFNNSALFANQGVGGVSYDSLSWLTGYESISKFFSALDNLQPKQLLLTVEVLEQRKILEVAIKGLQPQIEIAIEQKQRLNNDKQMVEVHERDMEANETFKFESEVAKHVEIAEQGRGSTNCPNCKYTCHEKCTFPNKKRYCHAMSWGKCTVCPGKCSWSDHVHENFVHTWKMVKETQTRADIEYRYKNAQKQKQTREETIRNIESDLVKSEAAVSDLIDESHRCTHRLQEIALKPNPVGIIEYINMSIESEKAIQHPGWEKRLASLEKAKRQEETKRDACTHPGASGDSEARADPHHNFVGSQTKLWSPKKWFQKFTSGSGVD